MTDREERTAFTVLVLSGIWMLARLISCRNLHDANDWRCEAIAHMDVIGQRSEAAAKYRRETTFREII